MHLINSLSVFFAIKLQLKVRCDYIVQLKGSTARRSKTAALTY